MLCNSHKTHNPANAGHMSAFIQLRFDTYVIPKWRTPFGSTVVAIHLLDV